MYKKGKDAFIMMINSVEILEGFASHATAALHALITDPEKTVTDEAKIGMTPVVNDQ
jgi:hypothetical protein